MRHVAYANEGTIQSLKVGTAQLSSPGQSHQFRRWASVLRITCTGNAIGVECLGEEKITAGRGQLVAQGSALSAAFAHLVGMLRCLLKPRVDVVDARRETIKLPEGPLHQLLHASFHLLRYELLSGLKIHRRALLGRWVSAAVR